MSRRETHASEDRSTPAKSAEATRTKPIAAAAAATGTLELREGSVVVDGIGRYHDVGLLMEATQERLVLHGLTAHARGGTLRVSGRAHRLGDALRFRYRLGVVADRSPIPLQEPVSATLDAELDGVVSRERLTSEAKLDGVRVYRRLADP